MSRIEERAQSDLQRQIDRLASLLEEIKAREAPAYPARYKTAAGQSIGSGSTTIVDFGTAVYDPFSCVTTGANWKYTAPVAGYYAVAAMILFTSSTTWADGEALDLRVYKGGSLFSIIGYNTAIGSASAIYKNGVGSTIVSLAEGEYIDVRVTQTSGGTLTLYTDADYNHVSIWKIQ